MKWTTLLLALMALTPQTLAQNYDIQLLRPQKVGAKCIYTGQAKIQETVVITREGQLLNRSGETFSVDLKGEREVTAVDDTGRVIGAKFRVVFCMMTRENKMKELAPRGSMIEATFKDGEEYFTLDGKPVDAVTNEALSIMIVLADGGPTNDQVFGTSSKQGPGSSWSVNQNHAAKSFAKSGVSVQPDAVKGTVTLKGKGTHGNQDVLEMEGQMTFQQMTVKLPDAYTLKAGSMTYGFSGKYPMDRAQEPLLEKKTMTLTIEAADKKDPKILLRSVTRQLATVKKEPVS